MKIKEKEQARLLRTCGKSIKSISRELNVSQSSVSVWVRDIPLTSEQYDLLYIKNPNSTLDSIRRLAKKSNTPYIVFNCVYNDELGVISNEINY